MLLVNSVQRQAALRAAWADEQRAAGKDLWQTPGITTLPQFLEQRLRLQWGRAHLPDRLMPPAAEWATLRELHLGAGGVAEARALLEAVRTLDEWEIRRSAGPLGDSPEVAALLEARAALERAAGARSRAPLRHWLKDLEPAADDALAHIAGVGVVPRLQAETLRRLAVVPLAEDSPVTAPAVVAAAESDEHELALISAWCRQHLERDPDCRLLVVDAQLRQRRSSYQRQLSQALEPSHWHAPGPRPASRVFAIEGGRALTAFPVIAHALLGLRLLTAQLRFEEVVQWLRAPFCDGADPFAGMQIERLLRAGHRLDFTATELAAELEKAAGKCVAAGALAAALRDAANTLDAQRPGPSRLAPSEWAPRLLSALRRLGWPGSRPLDSEEQQTTARWHALLDEYSSLGAWLPRATAAAAVATLADLAAERYFDPASVAGPITLTDSHDDPLVGYDAIWVAGLDAAQWPAPAQPDAFIPLGAQLAAGLPWASAAGQSRLASAALAAWRMRAGELTCSWARLDGDAERSPSPLLSQIAGEAISLPGAPPLAARWVRAARLAPLMAEAGTPWNLEVPVKGGVRAIERQAECGFRAYADLRLDAAAAPAPAPGMDMRQRGMLLHRALELVWPQFDATFLFDTSWAERRPMISDAVGEAIRDLFHGEVPEERRPALERERQRLELLIGKLLELETRRAPFSVVELEAEREALIAGGRFRMRIDRVDRLDDGSYVILDYKAGEAPRLCWDQPPFRAPQLIAYLLAEAGREVRALANVSLTNGQASFSGKSYHARILPGVAALSPTKTIADQEQAPLRWREQTTRWVAVVESLARDFLAGHAPVQPAQDVCRRCDFTILCRRVELAAGGAIDNDAHE